MLLVVAALSFGDPLRLQKVSKLERCCALHHLRCIHGASLRVSTLARASAAAILLATALSLAAAPGLAGAAGRSLEWRHLDVDARLDASGDLHVVERQAMVFTGDWNGGERVFRLERGQRLALERVLRVGDDGVARPLSEGSLDAVDRFAWAGARVLRWRSRAPRDPPFDSTEITYALEYTLSGVLVRTGGATYRLEHDFAFPDRPGPIREVRARLALDPAWDAVAGPLELVRRDVPPGAGAVLVAELRFVGFRAPPAFLVGYGLDHAENYRHLPFIADLDS